MNGLTIAVTSYAIAIIISLFVAGLIQLMGAVLARFSKDEPVENKATIVKDAHGAPANDAAIAAVIAIAKNY